MVIYVDVGRFDKNRELMTKHGVRGIPAILFFKPNGELWEVYKGRRDAQSFIDAFSRVPYH